MADLQEVVEIKVVEYQYLLKRDALLDAMEAAGVDNWDDGGMVREYMLENCPEYLD